MSRITNVVALLDLFSIGMVLWLGGYVCVLAAQISGHSGILCLLPLFCAGHDYHQGSQRVFFTDYCPPSFYLHLPFPLLEAFTRPPSLTMELYRLYEWSDIEPPARNVIWKFHDRQFGLTKFTDSSPKTARTRILFEWGRQIHCRYQFTSILGCLHCEGMEQDNTLDDRYLHHLPLLFSASAWKWQNINR